MTDIRSAFMGKEQATELSNHEQEMRRQREQRGKVINGVLGVVVILVSLLLIIGAICAAALMVRATF